MQGKTKGFLEDTGIILVCLAGIYGGYYFYTNSTSETLVVSSDNVVEVQPPIKKTKIIENNTTIEKEKVLVIEKTLKKEIKIPIINLEVKSENEEIVSIKKEKPQVQKEKNVDLVMLRKFLRNLKFDIASNIVKHQDLNTKNSQSLKIRVTVLSDGTYEDLKFVSGDKSLYEMNKENILKVFPLSLDEKIRDEFPRYVRISIR